MLIWISGKKSGVYALGTVITDPVMRSDSVRGQSYWTDPKNGLRVYPRVKVKYEKVLVEKPLYRDFLQCDPDLWNLSIFAQPRGTNFPVEESEWKAIEDWFEDD